MQEPPPAALDFLTKIRDIISSAKTKMRTKTFQPSLNDIPEDDYTYSSHSRPLSRSTSRAKSRMSFNIAFSSKDDIEDLTRNPQEYANVVSTDPQVHSDLQDEAFTVDSLDGCSDAGSRASTLKRIAKRVNERGTSFVSEIIKTLDRKNKDTGSDFTISPVKTSPFVKVHSSGSQFSKTSKDLRNQARTIVNSDEQEPALMKPSLLRSIMKDGKQKSEESSGSFDNFCQEMMATFNRIKRYSEAKTPISTLGRKKTLNPATLNAAEPIESSSSGDGKVMQWLEGLNSEEAFDSQSVEEIIEANPMHPSTNDAESLTSIEEHYDLTGRKGEDADRAEIEGSVTVGSDIILSPSVLQNFSPGTLQPSENSYEEINRPLSRTVVRSSQRSKSSRKSGIINRDDNSENEDSLQPLADHVSFGKNFNPVGIRGPLRPSETEDDINTSYDMDTLDRKPKRRNARSRSVLVGRYSDYCATDSEDFYDATSGVSLQSLGTHESTHVIERDSGHFDSLEGEIDIRNYDSCDPMTKRTLNAKADNSPEKPPLPPKQSTSPERLSTSPPVRPPKSNRRSPGDKPPLPAKETKSSKESVPPVLPQKTKIHSKPSHVKLDENIPELSDEAAASILLGLQAHPSGLASVTSKPDESDHVTLHTSPSSKYHADTLETNPSILHAHAGSHSAPQVFPSDSSRLKSPMEYGLSSPMSEDRIRGQFILAAERKSPGGQRKISSRSCAGSTSRSSSSDTDISKKNVKLCQCAKTELEKHFIEKGKPDADTIKKTWRRVVKKSDGSQPKPTPWKVKLANIEENQAVETTCSNCTKQKQDDSGYQSSDSSSSSKYSETIDDESSCSLDLECAESIDTALTSIKRKSGFGPQIFPKSQSLQHLKDVPVPNVYRSFEGSPSDSRRTSSGASSVKSDRGVQVPR